MQRKSEPFIKSAGDLEAIFIYETHDLLADIISDNFYKVLGAPPTEIRFHSSAAFGSFYVHADELISEASSVELQGKRVNLSLLSTTRWFIGQHPAESKACGLSTAYNALSQWLEASRDLSFWCGELGTQIEMKMTRARMIHYCANLHKHRLLRLNATMTQMRELCAASGLKLKQLDEIALRESFNEEIRSRLSYLGSWFVDLLGAYFHGINNLILNRFMRNPTNRTVDMEMPDGVTSNVIRDLYGSALVFKRYSTERIDSNLPQTPKLLKKRY